MQRSRVSRRSLLVGSVSTLALGACSRWQGPPPGTAERATRQLSVKVAAVQCSSNLGAVTENRDKLTHLVEEAAREGAQIVVLPEASITGYLSQDLKTNWHREGWP